ncbi:hypothetical protein BSL78_01226 [Apostichopus japonicus]|uniref:Integrase catalytic domain-containing protein n=1 Tax=Stichopus japonicus TaxID=307972 RepID=A0A2G8LNT0_STIJA|nr:hypothetical protein BSL78_01226 [Apostichopus japonicus]
MKFGFPRKLYHDQGREFENKLFSKLQEHADIKHSRTTPYHPQGNGQVERMNRTLLSMLRFQSEKTRKNWTDSLQQCVHAYNCTRCETTEYAPYFMMFGRSAKRTLHRNLLLPCDSLPLEEPQLVSGKTKKSQNLTESEGESSDSDWDVPIYVASQMPADNVPAGEMSLSDDDGGNVQQLDPDTLTEEGGNLERVNQYLRMIQRCSLNRM